MSSLLFLAPLVSRHTAGGASSAEPYTLGGPAVRIPQAQWRKYFSENAITLAVFDGE